VQNLKLKTELHLLTMGKKNVVATAGTDQYSNLYTPIANTKGESKSSDYQQTEHFQNITTLYGLYIWDYL
jgi:hypothetical protein